MEIFTVILLELFCGICVHYICKHIDAYLAEKKNARTY